MKQRKRRKRYKLKQPFRFIKNLLIILTIFSGVLFFIYKIFFEEDILNFIKTYKETIYNVEDLTDKTVYDSSYNVLILGTDEGLYSRTDSINLVTVNADKQKMVITNVPRDTYTPIACKDNKRDKINHANSYGGVNCAIDSLEQLLDTKIDFYIIMNFDAFINVINSLGTITTTVPDYNKGKEWCVKGDSRAKKVCFSKFGEQKVTAEQALAITRSRDLSSDLVRGQMQTTIMSDTLKEIIKIRDIEQFTKIVSSLGKDVKTNISPKQSSLMALNYYFFNRKNKEIERYQIEGENTYFSGEYVKPKRWYFIPNVELLNLHKKLINDLLK